jgi:predicted metalloprotease
VLKPASIRRGVVIVLTHALLIGGCTGASPVQTPPRDEPVSTGSDSRLTDERDAVGAVDGFWQRHFQEQTGRRYESPQVAGGYTGTSGPSCGGQPSVPGNAFYCPSNDFLAWDEDLMDAGFEQIGDAWVYLIIAHEWGHAIQARLQRDQVSVAAELQADCFAGATLFGAADRGLLQFERGDTEELAKTLAAVADDYPWTKESDHGDARQRTSSFNDGARGGPAACTR